MRTVNIHEAKTHFSKLVESAINGQETIIAKAGKPVAILSPITAQKKCFGILKGKIKIAQDFDAPLPEETVSDFES